MNAKEWEQREESQGRGMWHTSRHSAMEAYATAQNAELLAQNKALVEAVERFIGESRKHTGAAWLNEQVVFLAVALAATKEGK